MRELVFQSSVGSVLMALKGYYMKYPVLHPKGRRFRHQTLCSMWRGPMGLCTGGVSKGMLLSSLSLRPRSLREPPTAGLAEHANQHFILP